MEQLNNTIKIKSVKINKKIIDCEGYVVSDTWENLDYKESPRIMICDELLEQNEKIFDSEGRLVSLTRKSKSGDILKDHFTYDKSGNKTEINSSNSNGTVIRIKNNYEQTTNLWKGLTCEINGNLEGLSERTYDVYGNKSVTVEINLNKGLLDREEFTWDYENKICQRSVYKDGKLLKIHIGKYTFSHLYLIKESVYDCIENDIKLTTINKFEYEFV